MNIYQPNCWIIIEKIHENEVYHKVLGGWSGGYLDGNSWRMNSGITKITFDGEYYSIHGNSGSIYKCYKDSETVKMPIAGVYETLKTQGAKCVPIKDILSIYEKEVK